MDECPMDECPMYKTFFLRRGQRRAIVRPTLDEVMLVLYALCPGGKLVDIFDTEVESESRGRVQ